MGVPEENGRFGLLACGFILLQVAAVDACASCSAKPASSKAFTVELEALGLATVARLVRGSR